MGLDLSRPGSLVSAERNQLSAFSGLVEATAVRELSRVGCPTTSSSGGLGILADVESAKGDRAWSAAGFSGLGAAGTTSAIVLMVFSHGFTGAGSVLIGGGLGAGAGSPMGSGAEHAMAVGGD